MSRLNINCKGDIFYLKKFSKIWNLVKLTEINWNLTSKRYKEILKEIVFIRNK